MHLWKILWSSLYSWFFLEFRRFSSVMAMSSIPPASPLSEPGARHDTAAGAPPGTAAGQSPTLEQSNAGLRQALKQTVAALSSVMSLRDLASAHHGQRTAHLASAIAQEMGLEAERQEGLHLAALLHDIGQVQVPAEILTRPRPLTPEEFDLVRQHPDSGYQILCSIDFPWPVADIVLQHHENFNGSGYPHQLQGEQILLEARILRVADSCEAMLSHRPFRRAHDLSHVMAMLAKEGGSTFDSTVAAACLHLLQERRYAFPDLGKSA